MPKKPDKLKKDMITLETVFNNGGRSGSLCMYVGIHEGMYVCMYAIELIHADIDDGFDIDDDEFYAMLGVVR